MTFAFWILVNTLGSALASFNAHRCTIDGKAVDITKFDSVKSAPDFSGAVACKDTEGHLYEESRFSNGKRVWLREYNLATHQPSSESQRDENGKEHGIQKQFDTAGKGKVEYEYNYVHGSQEGVSKAFHYETGKLREQTYYENGKRLAALNYTREGKLLRVTCTEKSAPSPFLEACGFGAPITHEIYRSSGEAVGTQTFKNGKQIASHNKNELGDRARVEESEGTTQLIQKYPDGKTKTETRHDRQLMAHGVQRQFDESGAKTLEETFDHGRLLKSEAFYLNGQTKESIEADYKSASEAIRLKKTYFDNGQLQSSERTRYRLRNTGHSTRWIEERDGLYEEFDENALPVLVENWKDGKRDGVAKSYFANSRQISSERSYRMGEPFHEKAFTPTGELIKDDELFKDGSRKSQLKKKN